MPTVPTVETLATGLGAPVGSHFDASTNRLYFVEYTGRLSRYDLVRQPDVTLLNGVAVSLTGTWLIDLDTGALTGVGPTGDIWWNQMDAVQRRMVPQNGAALAYLGALTPAQFAALGPQQLQTLSYGNAPIVGDNNANNQLTPGTAFAVRTSAGNFSKVWVATYGYNLGIQVTTYRLKPAYQILGTGYQTPEDVTVSPDGNTAYITERTGNLLRVALNAATPPNRAAATVIASGMASPQQLSLQLDRGIAYVVEYAALGHLVRIDLATGAKTNVAFNLENAVGVVVTADQRYAFVSEQSAAGGRVRKITLGTGSVEALLGGFTAPFFMRFTDDSESAILIAERDPANRVSLIDLSVRPVVSRVVAAGLPFRPTAVAVTPDSRLLVTCDTVLCSVTLASTLYSGVGPLLLGIGHVPVDRIVGGYADTSVDPSYFFQVKDSPFGGSLPMMFNHQRARLLGATLYKVLVDGVEVRATWGDYRFSSVTNRFEYVSIAADANGFYPVRSAGELWYNAWLGLIHDSTALADGAHTLEVRIYKPNLTQIATPGIASSVALQLDNTWPTAAISTVFQGGTVPIGTCAVVSTGVDNFTFEITAWDPQKNLLSWNLAALWGDNQSVNIASDSYAARVSPSKAWSGLWVTQVPGGGWKSKNGQPNAGHCAYTFALDVWDRVIDGWGYIHNSSARKSLTIWL
jgi:hypothetical protein